MPKQYAPKAGEEPITLTAASRTITSTSRLRENILLLSGLGLVFIAATMVAGAMLG